MLLHVYDASQGNNFMTGNWDFEKCKLLIPLCNWIHVLLDAAQECVFDETGINPNR